MKYEYVGFGIGQIVIGKRIYTVRRFDIIEVNERINNKQFREIPEPIMEDNYEQIIVKRGLHRASKTKREGNPRDR